MARYPTSDPPLTYNQCRQCRHFGKLFWGNSLGNFRICLHFLHFLHFLHSLHFSLSSLTRRVINIATRPWHQQDVKTSGHILEPFLNWTHESKDLNCHKKKFKFSVRKRATCATTICTNFTHLFV